VGSGAAGTGQSQPRDHLTLAWLLSSTSATRPTKPADAKRRQLVREFGDVGSSKR
jgi:hypothetical protein